MLFFHTLSSCFSKLCFYIPAIVLYILVSAFTSVPTSECAENNFNQVVATVGSKVITSQDLNSRVNFIIDANKLPRTQETIAAVKTQVLQILIDESLFLQEGMRLKLKVEATDLENVLASIAKQNNIKTPELKNFLKNQNINYDMFIDQMKTQIIWKKIVELVVEPKVVVSNTEIRENRNFIRQLAKQEVDQVKLAEIAIFYGDDQSQALNFMNKLYSQIQNGANFEKLARSFSQSATAKKDGLIGWIHANQLSKEIMEKVLNTNIGSITQPIITGESIIILKVLDKKSKIKDKSNGQKNEEKVSDEEIRNWLYQRKLNLQIKLLLDKLRRDFYIEKKLSE